MLFGEGLQEQCQLCLIILPERCLKIQRGIFPGSPFVLCRQRGGLRRLFGWLGFGCWCFAARFWTVLRLRKRAGFRFSPRRRCGLPLRSWFAAGRRPLFGFRFGQGDRRYPLQALRRCAGIGHCIVFRDRLWRDVDEPLGRRIPIHCRMRAPWWPFTGIRFDQGDWCHPLQALRRCARIGHWVVLCDRLRRDGDEPLWRRVRRRGRRWLLDTNGPQGY